MRTITLLMTGIAFLSSSVARAQDSRTTLAPIQIRAVHVQVAADAAAALKPGESLEKLQQQALKDAQSSSASVQRSFLVSTLIGYSAMAQTGRRVEVVTGRTQARDRIMENTTTIELGTVFNVHPRLVNGMLVLELTYTSSSLVPAENEASPGETAIDRPDIRKITLETTLAMEADQPRLIKLNGDSDVDYLIITASWDAEAASQSSPSPPAAGSADQRPSLYPAANTPKAAAVAEAAGVDESSNAVLDSVRRYSVQLFKKYDANGDGALVAKEWEKMTRSPEVADTDKDGRVTIAEYAKHMQQRVDSARRARRD